MQLHGQLLEQIFKIALEIILWYWQEVALDHPHTTFDGSLVLV